MTLPAQLLDLLVDGPSSFAALYSAMNRLVTPVTVGVLWDSLVAMESAGWVRVRLMCPDGQWIDATDVLLAQARRQYNALPGASFESMSVDEVGIWFDITSAGRAEWERAVEATDSSPTWMLDQDEGTIAVHAEDAATAERVLADWLASHPQIRVAPGSRVVGTSSGYLLRDGRFIERGVRLQVSYE